MSMLLLVIVVAALSWGACVGLTYLICLCFGLKFSLLIATGIWLVILFIRLFFGGKKDND